METVQDAPIQIKPKAERIKDLHPGFRIKGSAQFKQNQIRRLPTLGLDYKLTKKKVVKVKKASSNTNKLSTSKSKSSKSNSSQEPENFHKSTTPPSKKKIKKKAKSSSMKKKKKAKSSSQDPSQAPKRLKKKRKVKNSSQEPSLAPTPASSLLAPTAPTSTPAHSLYPIDQETFFKATITGTCKLEEIRDSFIDSLTSILPEGTTIEIIQALENCIELDGRGLMEHDVILRLLAEGDAIDIFTKITQRRPASQREDMLSPSELLQVVNDKRSLIALYILESSDVIVSVETAEVVESPSAAPSLSTVPLDNAPARTESPSALPSSTLPSSRPSTSALPSLSWVPSSNPTASMSPSSSSSPTGQPSVSLSTLPSVSAPARTESPSALPSSTLPSSRPSRSASPSLSGVPSSNPTASLSPSSSSSPTGQLTFAENTSPPSEANASNSNNPSSSPSVSGTTFPSRSESIGDRPSNFSTAVPSNQIPPNPPSSPRSSTTLIVANKLVMSVSCILWLFF